METGQPVYARVGICTTTACKKRNDGEMSENGRKKGPNRRQMGAARRNESKQAKVNVIKNR
jgi:hypothetical protein